MVNAKKFVSDKKLLKQFNKIGKDIGFLVDNNAYRRSAKGNISIYKLGRKDGKVTYKYKKWLGPKKFNSLVRDSVDFDTVDTFYDHKLKKGFKKLKLNKTIYEYNTTLQDTLEQKEFRINIYSRKQAGILRKLRDRNLSPVSKKDGKIKDNSFSYKDTYELRKTKDRFRIEEGKEKDSP